MEQHGKWGVRQPAGLRAMSAPWSEILQTSKLVIPETKSDILLFGPDASRINKPGPTSRHMMHGYMILRDAIHAALKDSPIMMSIDMWNRLLDHRGWNSLWGNVEEERNPKVRAELVQLRELFLRFVETVLPSPPRPWGTAKFNGREYDIIEIEEPTTVPGNSDEPKDPSQKTKRRKRKAAQIAQDPPEIAQHAPSGPKMRKSLEDVPAADWDFLLWEIIELNHRGELRALTRMMSGGPIVEHAEQHIMRTILGDGHNPAGARLSGGSDSFSGSVDGLAGVTPKDRRRSIAMLLGLMKNWKVVGGDFLAEFPKLKSYLAAIHDHFPPGFDGQDSLETQEVAVLHAWARIFVEKFGRAPTAPRLCPSLEKL